MTLARAVRTELADAINGGTIAPGANMLAAGQTMPAPSEGFILSEGFVLSESGQTTVPAPNDSSLSGEP